MKFGLERFKLKGKFTWVRSNPIAMGSAVLGAASLVCLVAVKLMGDGFVTDVESRTKELTRIDQYAHTSARLPPQDIDQVPIPQSIVVNEAAIDYLRNIYKQMNGEYNQIKALTVEHNGEDITRRKHQPMLDNLFPQPGIDDLYKLYNAQTEYLHSFEEMFGPYSESARNPRMNAGLPVSDDEVKNEIKRVTANFLNNSLTPRTESDLTPAEKVRLANHLRNAALDLIKRQAEKIHVYAQTKRGSGYPFQIDEWATANRQPTIEAVWEGQMELWIQQDIVDAIGRCNGVADSKLNVIVAPIKRLISIKVVPGYIGINSSYVPQTGDVQLPNDFAVSPSGRKSNNLYDVRHVTVDMIVDYQQLPRVFDALAQSNFITVLRMEMVDHDPYEALKEGYYYGSGDTVEVKMLLETVWLRDWTSPLMPPSIKKQLGVPDDSAAGGPGAAAPAKAGS